MCRWDTFRQYRPEVPWSRNRKSGIASGADSWSKRIYYLSWKTRRFHVSRVSFYRETPENFSIPKAGPWANNRVRLFLRVCHPVKIQGAQSDAGMHVHRYKCARCFRCSSELQVKRAPHVFPRGKGHFQLKCFWLAYDFAYSHIKKIRLAHRFQYHGAISPFSGSSHGNNIFSAKGTCIGCHN